jgi:ferritin-like protein
MSSEAYHEPIDLISSRTKELHRATVSLIEELEAIDWYTQRADAAEDDELRAILIHNRNEEIEHAMMTLEWLRRNSPEFAERALTYLFTEGPIVTIEARAKAGGKAQPGKTQPEAASGANGALGIGTLRRP